MNPFPGPTIKWAVAYPTGKGVVMGVVVVGVVHSGLGAFAQALIIALVSAIIGAFGMIVSAFISARTADDARRTAERTEDHVVDLKRAIGAAQRRQDDESEGQRDKT